MTVGDEGRIKVYTVTISTSSSTTPIALTERGAASGPVQPLPHGRLLFTRNDFRTPNNLYVLSGLSAPHHSEPLHLEKVTRFGSEIEEKNIKLDEGEEFWFEGAAGRQIQGWALKPKGWNEAKEKGEPMQKRWPVLLLIHGGPEGAWEDQWSTR
jgi:dipeptidyl aminopeptidase/acylaminoacyl peptidase